jgi:4-diphosphocytidyl-2-C-methyl-D-erythritol kinase
LNRGIRLIAPAKINWTLEVLHIRPDGYHEISSVLQTIDLHDRIILSDADELELVLNGAPRSLADEPPERNLAVRAAVALRDRAGVRRGVRIELEKRIPVAAGLGGGSSDAAAILRGCNLLWDLQQPEINLIEIAGEIGSDPPFFVVGGTAAVSGRGDVVEPLHDALTPPLLLATPPEAHRGEKTARMFGALTPADYTEGDATLALRDAVQSRDALTGGMITNVFEQVTAQEQPATKLAMDGLRAEGLEPHLAGAGPSFFLLLEPRMDVPALSQRIFALGFEPRTVRSLSRAAALLIEDA